MAEEKRRFTSLSDGWDKQQIIISYKKAKHKVEQIGILAELTATDEETIVQILMDAGEFKGTFRKCNNCGCMFPSVKKGTKWCPECRDMRDMISRKKWRLKKNLVQIESYTRINAKLRQEIDEMERNYELLGKGNDEI